MAKYLLCWLSLIFLTQVACSGDAGEEAVADEFRLRFSLPQMVDVPKGEEYVFRVENGEAPVPSDVFVIVSSEGISYVCPFVRISKESFTVSFPAE